MAPVRHVGVLCEIHPSFLNSISMTDPVTRGSYTPGIIQIGRH